MTLPWLLARFAHAVQRVALWNQIDPGAILWFWWGCDREIEVRSSTYKTQRTMAGLRSLFEITLSPVQSTEGNYEHVSETQWSMITDLSALEKRAAKIVSKSKNRVDVLLAERFLPGLKRGKEDSI